MLWYKGWLETQFRLLLAFGAPGVVFRFSFFPSASLLRPLRNAAAEVAGPCTLSQMVVIFMWLGGVGIVRKSILRCAEHCGGAGVLIP